MKWRNNYLQSPLRGVLYRKPFWWVIPKVFNLMSLFNTIVTTEQARKARFQGRAKELSERKTQKWCVCPLKYLQAIHTLKCMSANIVLPIHSEYCISTLLLLIRISTVSPGGPPCPFPPWGWATSGLGWPIKAWFPWNTLGEGRHCLQRTETQGTEAVPLDQNISSFALNPKLGDAGWSCW